MKLALSKVAEFAYAGAGEFDPQAIAVGYSIDSRTIHPGELFFAVTGEKMDGHDFVKRALDKGAVAAVISREKLSGFDSPQHLIPVQDTLEALQSLAKAVRKLWAHPVVGVTGSAGKTTTKEAIAQVLSTKFQVHKSEGNFNNHAAHASQTRTGT
jgi:UDP-N-acetylmuramoyl-tripeptide--D-alanyl-D-alanine ligase